MKYDNFFDLGDSSGRKPAVHHKIPLDKPLTGDEAKQAVAEFVEILNRKPPVPVHKRRPITKPDSSGSSPPAGAGTNGGILPLSLSSVYAAIENGEIPCKVIGRRKLIPGTYLIKLLQSEQVASEEPA